MSATREVRPTPQTGRGLGFLLASTAAAITGQGMVIAAAPLLASSLTRDPIAVSAVTAASYAAWLLVGLPAGALVDRWSRKTVMVVTDLLRAVVLGVFTLLVVAGQASVPVLIVAVFLVGVGSCFFDPASQSTVLALVGRDKTVLTRANGKIWAIDTFGRGLAGPPLGAAAFGLAIALPFGVQTGAFLVSALFLLRLPATHATTTSAPPVLSAIKIGLRFVAKHGELRLLVLGMTVYNLCYNIAFAPLVLFAQDRLGLGYFGFGVLVAAMAVGGIAGGWTASHIGARLHALRVYAVALTVQGLAWTVVVVSAQAWIGGAALVFVGLASTTLSAVGGSARQLLTPDDMLGRMVSVTRIFGIGGAAVGAMIGGALASGLGLAAPFVVTVGLLVLAAGFFALVRPSRS